jgi:CheY-like chemotaxis protein
MSKLLLVDDDTDLVSLWKWVLERAGHEVETATSRLEAVARLASAPPDILIMDVGLPLRQDGEKLLIEARQVAPGTRILVLTGAPEWMSEAAAPDAIEAKPVRIERLLEAVAHLVLLLLCLALPAEAQRFAFETSGRGEALAELELSSPGSDWGVSGREAAMAAVALDGGAAQHVLVWAGEERRRYPIFLGPLPAGKHSLDVFRHAAFSAAGSRLEVHAVEVREVLADDPYYQVLAHAPVLYARPDTVGRFNDAPLLMYCERRGAMLEYTAVFSNEDGGTATRALMARWGRTTDIEYVYRHWLDSGRATIQAKDHKEIPFTGKRYGTHPALMPVTQNNMVSAEGESAVRYQIAPALVDLSRSSRERVMDDQPASYRVMARELDREGKSIDPRQYLYVEMRLRHRAGATGVLARIKDEPMWRASHLGRVDYAIARDGWVRTAVPLPRGTTAAHLDGIAFECLVPSNKDKQQLEGECVVEEVSRVFLLDDDYRPGRNLAPDAPPLAIATGALVSVPISR